MKIKAQGFTLVEIIIVMAVLAVVGIIGLFVYNRHSKTTVSLLGHSSSVAIGTYNLWLDVNGNNDFNMYYSLGLTGAQSIAPEAQSGKIKTVKLKVAKSDSKQIVINASATEEDWVRGSCELIEPWECNPPGLETKIDLPKIASSQSSSLSLILNINGKNQKYTVNIKDYKLSISGENGFSTNTVPLYPNGVASAIAVDQTKNSLCESVSSSQVIGLLRANNVQLASDKYKGIENVRPNEVLVYVPGKHHNDIVVPADTNGCVVNVIMPNLKQIE